MSKKTKRTWFYKKRGSYLPCSWQGLTIYLVYLVYVVALPMVWYWRGHDLWNLLVVVVPLMLGAALFTQFIASRNAK